MYDQFFEKHEFVSNSIEYNLNIEDKSHIKHYSEVK